MPNVCGLIAGLCFARRIVCYCGEAPDSSTSVCLNSTRLRDIRPRTQNQQAAASPDVFQETLGGNTGSQLVLSSPESAAGCSLLLLHIRRATGKAYFPGQMRQARRRKHKPAWLSLCLLTALRVQSVIATPVLQSKWSAKQVTTTDLCYSPQIELHHGVEIADMAYNEYSRQAMALTSGVFGRQVRSPPCCLRVPVTC